MVLVQSFEVDTQSWRPGLLVHRHAEHANDDAVCLIAGISGDGESRMRARGSPLFHDVAFVALEFGVPFEDLSAGVIFKVAEGEWVR